MFKSSYAGEDISSLSKPCFSLDYSEKMQWTNSDCEKKNKFICATPPKETWIIRPRTELDDKYDALQLKLDDDKKNNKKVLMISIIAFGVLGMLIMAGIIFAFSKFCKKKMDEAPQGRTEIVVVQEGEGGNG